MPVRTAVAGHMLLRRMRDVYVRGWQPGPDDALRDNKLTVLDDNGAELATEDGDGYAQENHLPKTRTGGARNWRADDLRDAFPGVGGFSRRNVFYMREFFLLYRDDVKVQPGVAQVRWSHNLILRSDECGTAAAGRVYTRELCVGPARRLG